MKHGEHSFSKMRDQMKKKLNRPLISGPSKETMEVAAAGGSGK